MVSDELGRDLHDRATRGMPLSAHEQAELEEWYGQHDARETATLAQAAPLLGTSMNRITKIGRFGWEIARVSLVMWIGTCCVFVWSEVEEPLLWASWYVFGVVLIYIGYSLSASLFGELVAAFVLTPIIVYLWFWEIEAVIFWLLLAGIGSARGFRRMRTSALTPR